jgi:hypothetical protein
VDATDIIAGYAAVVATVALGWEIWSARQARRPQVEVRLYNALLTFIGADPPWAAQIEVRNRGDLPVRVTSVGFNVQDGSGQTVVITQMQPGATLPGDIRPRDSGFTYLLIEHMAPLDPTRPLVAWASLSTGERIYSRPVTLRARESAGG